MNQGLDAAAPKQTTGNGFDWQVGFPNPADFNFDYHRLLAQAESSGLGINMRPSMRIAVVGAGIAGLTAARELFRCGYTNIDIFEAGDRIGGRLYSRPVEGRKTVFEMGAMRMPLFERDGRPASILGYYRNHFSLTTQPFPNPGSAVAATGIYLNEGFGPDPTLPSAKPGMLVWEAGAALPPDPLLAGVAAKLAHFSGLVTTAAARLYGTPAWPEFWRAMIGEYWALNFQSLALLPALGAPDPARPGYFGGLGLTGQEAEISSKIGAGDGGWAPYFPVSSLYFIRTLLFGFVADPHLFQGRFDDAGRFFGGPHCGGALKDSLGNPLSGPIYLGVQSVPEGMFFLPATSAQVLPMSLHTAMRDSHYGIRLLTRSAVRRIEYLGRHRVRVVAPTHEGDYDAVIVTAALTALDMTTSMVGFPQKAFPLSMADSLKGSLTVSSCKVFVALKERYWEMSTIPQLLTTDTLVRKLFGYAVETASVSDPGVALLSYTWQGHADRMLAEADDEALVSACIDDVDSLLARSGHQARLSDFVDRSQSAVIHWLREPYFRGSGRIYLERTWHETQALMTYNQSFSAESGLYFAGEAYAPDGTWTEPAMRGAIDAVLHVLHNNEGRFANGFDFDRDYPKHDVDWSPAGVRP